MKQLVFVDCETTGLDPYKDTILELALIKEEVERTWWIELTASELASASPQALKINRYYERSQSARNDRNLRFVPSPDTIEGTLCWQPEVGGGRTRRECAVSIARFTADCVLAGNTVKFDQQFLEAWLRRHGACPVWDYHVLDVPTFCAGVMIGRLSTIDSPREDLQEKLTPPFKSSNISEAMLCPAPGEEGYGDKHTALADARWSKRMWELAGAAAERAAPAA